MSIPIPSGPYDMIIHKIAIDIQDFNNKDSKVEVQLPRGSTIIHVDNQNNMPTFWYSRAAAEDIPLVGRNIYMFATGQLIPKELEHVTRIGTVLFHDGAFVFHFYAGFEEGTRFGL